MVKKDARAPGAAWTVGHKRLPGERPAGSAQESGGTADMPGNADPAASAPDGGRGRPDHEHGGVPEAAPTDDRERRTAIVGSWPVLAAAAVAGSLLAFLEKLPCRDGTTWANGGQYKLACYSDIYPLYFGEGLAKGQVPYSGHPVEYPVLIGAAMQAAAWVVRSIANVSARPERFFDVTAAGLALCAVAGVLATAYLAGPRRRRDALLLAFSPALILSAFINWDLIAIALVAAGMAAWAARRPALAGALLGLAVATKFYPIVFFGPLLLLCLRAGRMRAFWAATASGAIAWLAVNLPVMIAAPTGWRYFYEKSRTRPADWGAIWYFFQTRHLPLVGTTDVNRLNLLSLGAFAACCAAIAFLALAAPARPRVAQLFFLTLVAFLLTNKVWSPQYVIWVVPLAVLARPRFGAYALWQLAEIGYFFAIWWYLLAISVPSAGLTGFHGIGQGWYFTALLGRFVATALLAGLVVRDILRPGGDVVRANGSDDPAGGVLDGAADAFVLRRGWIRPAQLAHHG